MNNLKFLMPVTLLLAFSANVFSADEASYQPNEKPVSSTDDSDTPWGRRMEDVTGLFGYGVSGRAGSGSDISSTAFDTFTPWQNKQFTAVNGYGATQVGVGCTGLSLGTVLDGQVGQYQEMVQEFIQNAPTMAIMYLAYSQPTVKSVIDELNTVGQFGLDLSNMTCSGVRTIADKAHDENIQQRAEAECTAEAGYKSTECMSGDGLGSSIRNVIREGKEKFTSRTGALMSGVSSATGGLIGTGTNNGVPGSPGGKPPTKSCSGVDLEGTTSALLASSEMSCTDIKKYNGLIPSYSMKEEGLFVTPRTVTLEGISRNITNDYMRMYSEVISAENNKYMNTNAYKEMVNRADIIVTPDEHRFLRDLAKRLPDQYQGIQRSLATTSALKEIEIIISKLEVGVYTGLANQPDREMISETVANQYSVALKSLRNELKALNTRIKYDQQRRSIIQGAIQKVGG